MSPVSSRCSSRSSVTSWARWYAPHSRMPPTCRTPINARLQGWVVLGILHHDDGKAFQVVEQLPGDRYARLVVAPNPSERCHAAVPFQYQKLPLDRRVTPYH